jgi:hypothetical protein
VGTLPDTGDVLLAADGKAVFAGSLGGQILEAPASGGTFDSLALTPVVGLAVDAQDLFWSAQAKIKRCPDKDCTQPVLVATTPDAPMDLVVAGDVYFLAGSRVQRVARGGGTPIDVLMERPVAWTVDASGFTFTRANGVYRCPAAGCTTPAQLAPATAGGALATTASDVVWIDGTTIRKGSIGPPPGAPADLCAIGLDARSVVIGASRVYWREGNLRVAACPIGGGTPVVVAEGADAPATDLASDAGSIYWMTADRRVLRYAR